MTLNGLQSFSWIYDLHRLGQGIVKTEDASSVCQLVLQHIVKAFEADSGSLALLNHTVVVLIYGRDGVRRQVQDVRGHVFLV